MSNMSGPGLRDQAATRPTLRVVGGALLVVALFLLVSGGVDFFSAMNSDSMDGPHTFSMLFVGLLVLGPAGWRLQAGFMGAASRLVAGETMPCGTRNDAEAAYCDSCGASLGA